MRARRLTRIAQAHQPTPIARTVAEAELLNYEPTDARPGFEHLGVHITIGPDTTEVICWVGLCGDWTGRGPIVLVPD